MAAVAPASAALATHKKRQRREAKIREHYDRISAVLLSNDSLKYAARNPTRVIPAVPVIIMILCKIGFEPLTKAEVKRDCKDMEKSSAFMATQQKLPRGHLYKEDEFLSGVERSYAPIVPPENAVLQKYQRLKAWEESMKKQSGSGAKPYEAELQALQVKIMEIREKRYAVAREREKWEENSDNLRACLLSASEEIRKETEEFEAHLPALRNHLFRLLNPSADGSSSSAASSTSRRMSVEELLDALEAEEEDLERKIEDFLLRSSAAALTVTVPHTPHTSSNTATTTDSSAEAAAPSAEAVRQGLAGVLQELEDGLEVDLAELDPAYFANATNASASYPFFPSKGPHTEQQWEEGFVRLFEGGGNANVVGIANGNASIVRKKRQVHASMLDANGQNASANTTLPSLISCRSLVPRCGMKDLPGSGQGGVKDTVLQYVPLLFSPLSMYEDRYIGHVAHAVAVDAAVTTNTGVAVDRYVENLAVERRVNGGKVETTGLRQVEDAYLASLVRVSHDMSLLSDIHYLEQEVQDLQKYLQDYRASEKLKMEEKYLHAIQEEGMERERMKKEGVFYGLYEEKKEAEVEVPAAAPAVGIASASSSAPNGSTAATAAATTTTAGGAKKAAVARGGRANSKASQSQQASAATAAAAAAVEEDAVTNTQTSLASNATSQQTVTPTPPNANDASAGAAAEGNGNKRKAGGEPVKAVVKRRK
eukprot:gene35761-43377_t